MDNDNYRSDLPFYLNLSSFYAGLSGYILEMGCGTGRVSIPLAESGFKVVALDYSYRMLERAKSKAREQEVSEKIFWVRGDMTYRFFQSDVFNLVLIPFNSFQQILTKDRQYQTLENIRRILKKGGAFIAELSVPTLHSGSLTSEKIINLEGGKTLRRLMRSKSDPTTHIVTRVFEYSIIGPSESEFETICEDRNYCNIYPEEWETMLKNAGFHIEKRYGDFKLNEFSESSKKMLFLCRSF